MTRRFAITVQAALLTLTAGGIALDMFCAFPWLAVGVFAFVAVYFQHIAMKAIPFAASGGPFVTKATVFTAIFAMLAGCGDYWLIATAAHVFDGLFIGSLVITGLEAASFINKKSVLTEAVNA